MDSERTIRTDSGFTITIAEDALDDMELFDALCEMDKGNMTMLSTVIPLLLGKNGKKELYDHLRGQNGRVRLSDVVNEITDILGQLDGKKK